MICQCSGNGVSKDGLQQEKGRARNVQCTENRAAVHSFMCIRYENRITGCQ